jgi:hypothetical protein
MAIIIPAAIKDAMDLFQVIVACHTEKRAQSTSLHLFSVSCGFFKVLPWRSAERDTY